MNCQDWMSEIVECSRSGIPGSTGLEAHVRECSECREYRDTEEGLSAAFEEMRAAVRGARSPDFRREQLMAQFERIHRPVSRPRFHWPIAAAAAVAAVAVGLSVSSSGPTPSSPAKWQQNVSSVAETLETADDSDFVAVPYSAPLAPGETVKVMRTQLYAAALYRMGVSVPATGEAYSADVVTGEDGLPRAVRVLGEGQIEN